MKYVRFIKFAVAILFFELMLGKICYEYGYARGGYLTGIASIYIMAAYALIYVVICICQGWGDTSRRTNIFSTLFLAFPYISLVVFICTGVLDEVLFAVLTLVIFGIAMLMEAGILIFTEIQDKIVERRVKTANSEPKLQ